MRSHARSLKKSLGAILLALGLAGGFAGGCQTNVKSSTVAEIPAGAFTRKWMADLALKGDEATDVFVRDNLIIVYTRDHFAYVLDRESGTSKWVAQVSSGGVKLRPPLVLKDYIVFPTISSMEVYDRFGKHHRGVAAPGLALRSGATGYGTRVFFGADDPNGGRVVNLDLAGSQYQNSSVIWTLQTLSGISATPVIHQGLLYAGDDSGGVYAVNADSRAPIWAIKHEGREQGVFGTGAGIRADLKADEYGVYVASLDTKLYCIGRTDGRIRWQFFAGQPLLHSPTVTPTLVYQFIEGRGLIAIDKTQGEAARKAKWTIPDAVQFLAEDEKYAYLERTDHLIIAVDKNTGDVKFKSKRGDFVAYGTALKNNVIFAVTREGQVRAIVPVLTAGAVGEIVFTPVAQDAIAAAR
jgi:outer membrane protein assembly factor BamB